MRRLISVIILFIVFAAPFAAFGEDARINDLTVKSARPLKASFVVVDAFTRDMEEAIKSGMPTSFTFLVELQRLRGVWVDESAGSWAFMHTVKYDNLKEEYEITLDERGERPVKTKDFNEMKRLMTVVGEVELPAQLQAGARYELSVMAELKTIELPFLLDYMLFFVKYWEIETDWQHYTFTP